MVKVSNNTMWTAKQDKVKELLKEWTQDNRPNQVCKLQMV